MVPALAAGCCIILKPSELAPLSCLLLADMCTHAGEYGGNLFKQDEGGGEEGEEKRREEKRREEKRRKEKRREEKRREPEGGEEGRGAVEYNCLSEEEGGSRTVRDKEGSKK